MTFDFQNVPPGIELSESRTASNNAVGIILFILSFIFVGLRLFVRLRMKREPLGLDDHLMSLGLVLNAGNLACCIAGGFYGLGKHIWSLDEYKMRQITIITFAYVFIYAWSVCIIKFSILALYRRIFGLTWIGYCCVGLTTGYLITNHIILPLYTSPLSYYWNQWRKGYTGKVRIDEAKFYLGVGIINLFGDMCILAVPVSSVVKLHMERSQKIAISLMFLLGSFVCFASLYRIITITRLVRTDDISWAKSDVFIWSSVEPSIGIISGCLPTMRPLLLEFLSPWRKLIPPSKKSSSAGSGKSARPYPLNALETISRKRTRKVSNQDELDTLHFTQLDDESELKEGVTVTRESETAANKRNHTCLERWRPDDDDMCLTTTVVQRSDSEAGLKRSDHGSVEEPEREGITMTKRFEWDETSAQKKHLYVVVVRRVHHHVIIVEESCDLRLLERMPLDRIFLFTTDGPSYLSSVEKRAAKLESLLSQLLPGINIDDAICSPELTKATLAGSVSASSETIPTTPAITCEDRAQASEPILPEAVPNSADGFNWQEENVSVDGLTDGMAALSVEPSGVGYLGSTSGVVFLRCLLDWAGFLHQSRLRDNAQAVVTPSAHRIPMASSQISHAALVAQFSSTLMDAYFEDYHVSYPFLHEATFRAQYHEIIARPAQRSWDMLYHAVLALGAWSLNKDHVGLEDYLYRRALTLGQHESVFEAANLTTVQALVLLSNLSQKRNSPNTGWNLLGLAVRTALSLALHRELPHWNISLLDREIRRRVWWGLFIFDSGASTTFGRAIMLPDHDTMNVHAVLNIEDSVY
ncbi:hypothetical protein ACEQ8H_002053 [Pleosporales sp. CAS-2024a]